MSKEEALNTARGLVREAVDAAGRAGIDPALVVAPHCPETPAAQDADDGRGSQNLMLGEVPGVIDNSTEGLFEMPEPDKDPEQKPAFVVTQTTADFVRQDFERYKPSLERMVEDWEEKKVRIMSETKNEEKVNVSSVEFKQGVEAGLNSEEATKNWKAGNELGQELKEEGEGEDAG